MSSVLKTALFAGALAALAAPAFSQSAAPAATPAPTVQERKENQQDRIANGVQSGQLTAGETKNLETKEAGLNKEEHTMRKEDDGHLTASDRASLQKQQSQLSKNIYADKHNAAAQKTKPKTEVGQRQRNQQERIAQGVKSGQLTPRETAHLEGREAAIHHEVKNDPLCAGPVRPAGGAAGSAEALGPDVLRTQPRFPTGAQRAASGARGAAVHCRRVSLGGGSPMPIPCQMEAACGCEWVRRLFLDSSLQ